MRTFGLSEGCADAQLLRRSRSDSHDSSLGTFPSVPAYSLCLRYRGTASSRLGTQPLFFVQPRLGIPYAVRRKRLSISNGGNHPGRESLRDVRYDLGPMRK